MYFSSLSWFTDRNGINSTYSIHEFSFFLLFVKSINTWSSHHSLFLERDSYTILFEHKQVIYSHWFKMTNTFETWI